MPKNNKTAPLKHAEVVKKILAKPKKVRSPLEWFDDLGKYRDEHISEYEQKKADFMRAAQQYNKMNMETMMCQKVRLNSNYEANLDLGFLKGKEHVEEECDRFCCCPTCEQNKTGRLLRKRSIRKIKNTTDTEDPPFDLCLIEPWFKRYLTLNKFIWAGRTVIIQNRLLKVLNTLKSLKLEDIARIKVQAKKCEDFHCHPVFERFL